jgi:fibronectin-binding autotransporter adhesin
LGQDAGEGYGGAVYSADGSVAAWACLFETNRARGGNGGGFVGPSILQHGEGGLGRGGVIFNVRGSFVSTNCVFRLNEAVGGNPGGDGKNPGYYGTGAPPAEGGTIYTLGGTAILFGCTISSNAALPGGARLFQDNYGGFAFGGAIYNTGAVVSISKSAFIGNRAVSTVVKDGAGGAIYQAAGTTRVDRCWLSSNIAAGGEGAPNRGLTVPESGGAGLGGALCIVGGQLEASNSTLSANSAFGGFQRLLGAAGVARGGALYIVNARSSLVNCTLAGNQVIGGSTSVSNSANGEGSGGALYFISGMAALKHVTVAYNTAFQGKGGTNGATGGGGGLRCLNGATLQNTLVAWNSPSNFFVPVIDDRGNNLSSDTSCRFYVTPYFQGTDPKIRPLGDYGGPTPTIALTSESPAIDAGAGNQETDQRGAYRPGGAAPDIGAFEFYPSPEVLLTTDGKVQLHFGGSSGREYRIEASTDLRTWSTIGRAVAAPDGIIEFLDADAPFNSHRFYRTALP